MIKLNANIGGLRPNYTEKEYQDFLLKVQHLTTGSSVRFGSIFHEIFWNPNDAGNFWLTYGGWGAWLKTKNT